MFTHTGFVAHSTAYVYVRIEVSRLRTGDFEGGFPIKVSVDY